MSIPSSAGEITGTIKQIIDNQEVTAKGTVSVGLRQIEGAAASPMMSIGEAMMSGRVARFEDDGSFLLDSVPEGVSLYISVFLDSGYGKYSVTTLEAGQTLDISQTIPDSKDNGTSFKGTLEWPVGVEFKEKTSRTLILLGEDNTWSYIPIKERGLEDIFLFDHIQPGAYRLGVYSTLANGDDRYDELEITVTAEMETPLTIEIPE